MCAVPLPGLHKDSISYDDRRKIQDLIKRRIPTGFNEHKVCFCVVTDGCEGEALGHATHPSKGKPARPVLLRQMPAPHHSQRRDLDKTLHACLRPTPVPADRSHSTSHSTHVWMLTFLCARHLTAQTGAAGGGPGGAR